MKIDILAATLTALLLLSCNPDETASPVADGTAASALLPGDSSPGPLTPMKTVRRVHQYRVTGQLAELKALLLPEQEAPVLELLLAVDRFLAADAGLRTSVSRYIGPASALAFDRSEVGNRVGVFSRDVTVLKESVDGDRAVVMIQVADRLPLQKVNLIRREGVWLIETDPPIPGAAAEIRAMAEVLAQAAESLAEKPPTAEEKQVAAAQLRAEIESRQAAVARRLRALAKND